jgi:hypothetical protein
MGYRDPLGIKIFLALIPSRLALPSRDFVPEHPANVSRLLIFIKKKNRKLQRRARIKGRPKRTNIWSASDRVFVVVPDQPRRPIEAFITCGSAAGDS